MIEDLINELSDSIQNDQTNSGTNEKTFGLINQYNHTKIKPPRKIKTSNSKPSKKGLRGKTIQGTYQEVRNYSDFINPESIEKNRETKESYVRETKGKFSSWETETCLQFEWILKGETEPSLVMIIPRKVSGKIDVPSH